jgi:hypothetical protein
LTKPNINKYTNSTKFEIKGFLQEEIDKLISEQKILIGKIQEFSDIERLYQKY